MMLVVAALLPLLASCGSRDHPSKYNPTNYRGHGTVAKNAQGRWEIRLPIDFPLNDGGTDQVLTLEGHPAMDMQVSFELQPLPGDDAQLDLWQCELVFTKTGQPENFLLMKRDVLANLTKPPGVFAGFDLGRAKSVDVYVNLNFQGPRTERKSRTWTLSVVLTESTPP